MPPFGVIRDALQRGEVIPFLGAGASLEVRVPPEAEWRDQQGTIHYLPTARELALHLAQGAGYPANVTADLTKVAQYYDMVSGRDPLRTELHAIFDRDAPYTSLHSYLASIAKPLLVVTTNYDDLIERGFHDHGKSFDVIVHSDLGEGDRLLWWHGKSPPVNRPWWEGRVCEEVSPKKLDIDLATTTVLYKMHGAVARQRPCEGNFVITEDDYVDFLARMVKRKAIPAIFAEPFQSRHFLFLGYGLNDWNLRVVLNQIEQVRFGKGWRNRWGKQSWAIQLHADAVESRLWAQRHIDIYFMNLEQFVQGLQGKLPPQPALAN